jgi:hypothetical protein
MMKWIALAIAITVIASCFFTWVTVESKNVFIGGFNSNTNVYGKPGLFHTVLVSIVILMLMINKNWSIRAAFFISAFNVAWALRNFIRLSSCEAGICPEKQAALYILLAGSLILPIIILFTRRGEKYEPEQPDSQNL